MRNNDPFMPWNDPMNKSDPFKVYNDPMNRNDPFAPWKEGIIMRMVEQDVIDVGEDQEDFGQLVVVKDSALMLRLTDMDAKIKDQLVDAETFSLTQPKDKDAAREKIIAIADTCKDGLSLLEKHHRIINKLTERVRKLEKPYTTPTTPNTKADPEYIGYQATQILKKKLNDRLDLEETERKKEETRLQELANKERERRLAAISTKLDKLTDGISDLATQKAALESALDESLTDEENDALRARIEAVEAKIAQAQGRIVEQQTRVQEAAVQTTVSVQTPKTTGVSSKKKYVCTGVSNGKAILQQMIAGTVPMGVIKWDLIALQKLKNMGIEIPGADFVEERSTTIRR